ncbi:DUF6311 domain-containing protein [Polynucleobacter sp. IMCC 30228]|uniref:DUF6311 domain-containing protein n=1 Tax=Polynucleobacter sp. IMCC 30228 TaxID=2781011 RepID=UPI001F15C498|nr:DUF6311 domain-containing protein [Polynucleobacter sp. IMCC 30228]
MIFFNKNTPLIPLFFGIVFFYLIVGLGPLDPSNLSWIFGRFDPPQHYLGWVFYRYAPWTFPIGLSPNFGMDISSSIVYTDSLPLMAIFFKLFSPILPQVFQYFGIWLLVCFLLQAWFSWKIISLISNNFWVNFFGTGLLSFSPPMFWRLYTPSGTQASLVAHFLILAALFLLLRKSQERRIFSWTLLLSVAVLTHFYLFAIVSFLWISDLLDRSISQKVMPYRKLFYELFLVSGVLLLCTWQVGYFSIMGSSGIDSGYGFFKLNVLGPIDPSGWSYLLPNIPIPTSWGEGFNYLGLGAILVIVIACILLIFFLKPKSKALAQKSNVIQLFIDHRFLCICLFFLYLDAITNNIGIGARVFSFELPLFLSSPLHILRSSARLWWPIHYCLIIFSIYLICKVSSTRIAIVILTGALVLQVVDTKQGWALVHKELAQDTYAGIFAPDLKNPFWQSAAQHYKKIIRIPAMTQSSKWVQFAWLASEYGMKTNSVYFARVDNRKIAKANQALKAVITQGEYDPNALYVFEDRFLIPILATRGPNDIIAKVDGFLILAPGWKTCKSCVPVAPEDWINNDQLPNPSNNAIGFSNQKKDKDLVFYLENGWSWQEDWGTWSDGKAATLNIPWPKKTPHSITLNFKTFLDPNKHPSQTIDIWINGFFDRQIEIRQYENNFLTLPLSKKIIEDPYLKLEFRFKNPVVPNDLVPENKDKRTLGIGLISAQFK